MAYFFLLSFHFPNNGKTFYFSFFHFPRNGKNICFLLSLPRRWDFFLFFSSSFFTSHLTGIFLPFPFSLPEMTKPFPVQACLPVHWLTSLKHGSLCRSGADRLLYWQEPYWQCFTSHRYWQYCSTGNIAVLAVLAILLYWQYCSTAVLQYYRQACSQTCGFHNVPRNLPGSFHHSEMNLALASIRFTPHTIHHSPHTIHHTPHTIHHTPYTIHHTPYTTHHTPYTSHRYWPTMEWKYMTPQCRWPHPLLLYYHLHTGYKSCYPWIFPQDFYLVW